MDEYNDINKKIKIAVTADIHPAFLEKLRTIGEVMICGWIKTGVLMSEEEQIVALEGVQVYLVGLQTDSVGGMSFGFHSQACEQLYQLVHIVDVGQAIDGELLLSEQTGAQDLKGFVFSALWGNFSRKTRSAAYFE